MTNKLTKKDFYNSVIAMAEGLVPAMTAEEIVAAAQHELDLLAKKAGKAAGPNPDDAPIKEAVMNFMTDAKDVTATAIGSAIGHTAQKVTPRLKALVAEGKLAVTVVKGSSIYNLA